MAIVSACSRDCTDTCSLILERDEKKGLRVRGNPDHPVTAGFTCAKIRDYPRRLTSPNRITEPLLKGGAGWRAIDWDRALDLAAGKIQSLRHTPERMLHLFGGGDHGLMARFPPVFFGWLGTSYSTGANLCDEAGLAACQADFGTTDQNDFTELAKAARIVIWGKDPSRSGVHTAVQIKKARRAGAKVITISPGGDDNAALSDHMILINPDTDRFLAAAVILNLLDRGAVSQAVTARAANWPEFRELISGHNIDDLLNRTGLSRAELDLVSDMYADPATNGPCATVIGWGVQRYAAGGETVRFINAVTFLSGNLGLSGGGSYFSYSSGRNFDLSWATAHIKPNRRHLPVGMLARELAGANPPVELAWVSGFNVINQAPNSRAIAQYMNSIPFKVVAEAFMTDTAARSDLILPCALMWEKEDLAASYGHNYVNYCGVAAQAPGQAKTDHWILTELGRRLDPVIDLPDYETCLRRGLNSAAVDIDLDELRRTGFARGQWANVPFEGLRFAHPDGLYRFPEQLNESRRPPDGYPLRLLSAVRKRAIHSQILPEEHPPLPTAWLAPDCPAWQGHQSGQQAWLVSPLARLKVILETRPGLHPGLVLYRRGDWMSLGGGQNQLIEARLTDLGQGTAFYEQFVRVEWDVEKDN